MKRSFNNQTELVMTGMKASVLADKVLSMLSESGMSQKAVWTYKQYGFKPILKFLSQNNIDDYSESTVSGFMESVRGDFEQEKLMTWKWQKIRKATVLMSSFYRSGKLDMNPLVAWEVEYNPLHRRPSEMLLSNPDNMAALVYRVKEKMAEFNISKGTLKAYVYYGFDPILRYCADKGIDKYDKLAIREYVRQQEELFHMQIICDSAYQKMRKAALMLDEYYSSGSLCWHHQPRIGTHFPNDYFTDVWDQFHKEHVNSLSRTSLNTIRSAVFRFMLRLEDKGNADFFGISHRTVNDCIVQMAEGYAGGENALLFSLRTFLRFLKKHGITESDLSEAIPTLSAPRRVIRDGFSESETKSLLGHPNIETAIGKRDYAIMTIASQTGLRAVDIKNLKRSDIDWRTNEIRIIQHKTKRALSIPLRTEMGNAIADYLLHGRPESSIPNIFLCAKSPIRPLGDYTISHIVTTHMKCAGVAKKTRRGSHSFRRSFGKKLLVAETSLDMLSELLGHTNINSSKTYAAINERELKMCALNLSFIRKENE